MVGSPMRNYWVDDGKLTLNSPARLLDESGQWIPSTVEPVANTIELLRPACEADRDNRRNSPDSNDTNKTRGAKRKREEEAGTTSLEIVTPARSARHLAPVPEFENTRQRGMSQPRKLYPAIPRTRRVANLTATRHDVLPSPRYHRPPPTGSQLPLPRPLNTSTTRHDVPPSPRYHRPPPTGSQLPLPRPLNTSTTRHDVLPSPQYHRPPPTGSQLPLPRPLITSTQRGNPAGFQKPMTFAPLYGIGHRPAPRVRHTTTVHRTLPIRRTGPIVGSTTAARQPTPTLAPLTASGGDHQAQVHNRIAARQYPPSAAPVTFSDRGTYTPADVTTRVFEYPSPPRQSSYFTAGDELTYQRNGQVRMFPGPYFISREQAYKIGRWQFYPALPSSLATAAIDQTREYNNNNRRGVSYIDPATGAANIFARSFPHDDEVLVSTAEPNHERPSFHISCEHCGSQGHITIECPLHA